MFLQKEKFSRNVANCARTMNTMDDDDEDVMDSAEVQDNMAQIDQFERDTLKNVEGDSSDSD